MLLKELLTINEARQAAIIDKREDEKEPVSRRNGSRNTKSVDTPTKSDADSNNPFNDHDSSDKKKVTGGRNPALEDEHHKTQNKIQQREEGNRATGVKNTDDKKLAAMKSRRKAIHGHLDNIDKGQHMKPMTPKEKATKQAATRKANAAEARALSQRRSAERKANK